MVENYFIFKEVKTNVEDVIIKDEGMPFIQEAEQDVEIVEVPGRDGFLTVNNQRKKPVTKVITGVLINKKNKYEMRRWLKGRGKLILSNDADVFYNASIITPPAFTDHWSGGWAFNVSFLCQPYGYLHDGEDMVEITKQNTFIHNQYESTNPLLRIYGNGKVNLFFNNREIAVTINEYIDIDSELKESYKGHKLNPFNGDFPIITNGMTDISWTGTVSKIEVIPRWRR